MAEPKEGYTWIVAESYRGPRGGGYSEKVHIRPVTGEMFSRELRVEGLRSMIRNHPVGTRFRVRVKLTDRRNGADFLYSRHSWDGDRKWACEALGS